MHRPKPPKEPCAALTFLLLRLSGLHDLHTGVGLRLPPVGLWLGLWQGAVHGGGLDVGAASMTSGHRLDDGQDCCRRRSRCRCGSTQKVTKPVVVVWLPGGHSCKRWNKADRRIDNCFFNAQSTAKVIIQMLSKHKRNRALSGVRPTLMVQRNTWFVLMLGCINSLILMTGHLYHA